MRQLLPEKFSYYGRGLNSVPCVALARKASHEIRITIYLCKSLSVHEINKLVVTSNKLTNLFAGIVTSGLV
jgi:hypothetical protein